MNINPRSNESLLIKQAGCEPIGLVMGSSFFKAGFSSYFPRGHKHSGELEVLTAAQRQAHDNALARLQAKAAKLGAHGVIDVRLQRRGKGWRPGLIKFTAIGTAIRIPGGPRVKKPFTSHLSGQEFWALRQAGYWPKGLVVGACTYYIDSDQETNNPPNATRMERIGWGNARRNQELLQYTQGFAEAREIAASRLQRQIQALEGGALTGQVQDPQSMQSNHSGIGSVGMDIGFTYESVTYEPFLPVGCFLQLIGASLFLTLIVAWRSGNPIAGLILTPPLLLIGLILLFCYAGIDIAFILIYPLRLFLESQTSFINSVLLSEGPQKDWVINVIAIGTAIVPDEGPPRSINRIMITPLSES
jgi:uncharacterized protein YbjQ (UPF0145 family)